MTTKTIDEKIDIMLTDHETKVMQASKKWDGYPVKKSHKELKQQIQALITKARADERQVMLDALNGLYEPSIPDLELNEYKGKDEPVIYKSQMESAIKKRGGKK